MKGQTEHGAQLWIFYLTVTLFIVLSGLLFILRSSTWAEMDLLYGKPENVGGKVTRIYDECSGKNATLFMIDGGDRQALVYAPRALELYPGDYVYAKAYGVHGLGLVYSLTRSRCEPDGKHYFAVEIRNERDDRVYSIYATMK